MTGRYAPSPTGDLHLGNLRTALLAWLFARSRGGRFLMRMEDLDRGRVREPFYDRQLEDMAALGIDWDGPVVRQSQRTELYESALAELEVYPCWCTRAEIREAASAPHGDLPEGAYPGTCRRLTAAERAEREASRRPPAVRLAAGGERVEFEDELLGRRTGVVDDFVLRRGDGAFAYNLAVVVDDADQGVEQVVRGDDLLDSTPRQILLASRLGVRAPAYAHVPLVLGPDGARLAKRHGAVTLADRRALGESPAHVVAFLASTLGMEGRSAPDLLDQFDPARLPREPAVLDQAASGSSGSS